MSNIQEILERIQVITRQLDNNIKEGMNTIKKCQEIIGNKK